MSPKASEALTSCPSRAGNAPSKACPTAPPPGTWGATTVSSSPRPLSRPGSRPPGKKKVDALSRTYLEEALADFSGYLAIDEVYDGPFGILSVVDNHTA